MSWLSDEIRALRTAFNDDRFYLPPTDGQLGLNGKISEVIKEENRHSVLQLITGVRMWDGKGYSTKTLTRWMFTVMINWWMERDENDEIIVPWRLTEDATRLLRECEAYIEANAPEEPWRVDPLGL